MSTVYLLGSGFSKAVSAEMPTLAELSDHVRSALTDFEIPGADTPIAANFEQWLSYLLEPAPWLGRADQLANESAFYRVAGAVQETLEAIGTHISLRPLPDWLTRLVGYWEATSATVISFNYDMLIEAAWLGLDEVVAKTRPVADLYPVPLAPAAARVAGVYSGPLPMGGLKLLKLHGSLSWWYSGPGSPPGDPVYDIGLIRPTDSIETSFEYRYDSAYVADKACMIVPPTSVKDAYYSNNVLTSLWRQAATALAAAEELVVMGFSVPVTDLSVSSMLATTLADAAFVTPVDRDDQVVTRLRHLLEPDATDHSSESDHTCRVDETYTSGEAPIERWVGAHADLAPPA